MKDIKHMELGRQAPTISRRNFVLGAATLALVAGCGTNGPASVGAKTARAIPKFGPQVIAGATPSATVTPSAIVTPSATAASATAATPATTALLEAPATATAAVPNTTAAPTATAAVPDAAPTAAAASTSGAFEVAHSEEEWRVLLSPEQYGVLRNDGTEKPYSSPLNDERATGVFSCAGCALDAFSSRTKFESGTGWPSFWQAMGNSVLELPDTTYSMMRTKVLCRRCGGHLGHVFDDGPNPTGLRYCLNGVALSFRPDS